MGKKSVLEQVDDSGRASVVSELGHKTEENKVSQKTLPDNKTPKDQKSVFSPKEGSGTHPNLSG